MAVDLTHIVNEVLTLFGRPQVANVKDDESAERLLASVKSLLKIQLSDHDWSFSIKYKVSNRELNAVHPKFKYGYEVPDDMLRKIDLYTFTYDSNGNPKESTKLMIGQYVIEDKIYTDQDGVMLKYVSSDIPSNDRTVKFVHALSNRVASNNAMQMTENSVLKEMFDRDAKVYLNQAIALDVKNYSDLARY